MTHSISLQPILAKEEIELLSSLILSPISSDLPPLQVVQYQFLCKWFDKGEIGWAEFLLLSAVEPDQSHLPLGACPNIGMCHNSSLRFSTRTRSLWSCLTTRMRIFACVHKCWNVICLHEVDYNTVILPYTSNGQSMSILQVHVLCFAGYSHMRHHSP
jgi:hypothetical protein